MECLLKLADLGQVVSGGLVTCRQAYSTDFRGDAACFFSEIDFVDFHATCSDNYRQY